MSEPLWNDDDIEVAVLLIENRYGTEASMMAAKELKMMSAEYQTRIQLLEAEVKRLKAWQKDAIVAHQMARGEAACDG